MLSEESLRALSWAAGALASTAIARMEAELSWFPRLSAHQRSSIGLVVQSGVSGFVRWCRSGAPQDLPLRQLDLFGAAPRDLVREVPLEQTVELVRMALDAADGELASVLDEAELPIARELVLRYGREVAFAGAEIYARAAESRGAWDARLEALVVDALVRGESDEALASQASALSWPVGAPATVIVAEPGEDSLTTGEHADRLRRAVRRHGGELLLGVQGERLVLVVGAVEDVEDLARDLVPLLGDGPVVVGPTRPGLPEATRSARAALAGVVAASAWPGAPRPVLAAALLPERVLAGDVAARRAIADLVWHPLVEAGGDLVETLQAYLDTGGVWEATARLLYVHTNTVRYRLGRIAEVTSLRATDPRERWVLQVGLVVGRLAHGPRVPRVLREPGGQRRR